MEEPRAAGGATIERVELVSTPEGEGALTVGLVFPNGGRSTAQVPAEQVAAVLERAGVRTAQELVGRSWTVLQVRAVSASAPLPAEGGAD